MRVAQTIFGPVLVSGPFADDYTKLKWVWKDHRDGETARFQVAGLEVYAADMDGDGSWWQLKDIRARTILATGQYWAGETEIPDFWQCLVDAEAALRAEVADRKQRLISLTEG